MKRIFAPYAYSDAPRQNCWWDQTASPVTRPSLVGDHDADVAIIGAGFTGLNAALNLAQSGARVVVLDAKSVGWGASGRNGGFCCLGGGMLNDTSLIHQFGEAGCVDYRATERAAIDLVDDTLRTHSIDVDRHSDGETELAHRAKDMQGLRDHAAAMTRRHGIETQVIEKQALADHGMNGPFHGAITIKAGFGLNPRKYIEGLAKVAEAAGAMIFHNSPVTQLQRVGGRHHVLTGKGCVVADKVIIATNGYSSEDMPPWMAGRYLPMQSNVIVTRPLTKDEIAAQGWSSDQMAYDSRHLLHYFRLMPDRRFLFGMRGGLRSSPAGEARAQANIRRDFDRMFPAWQHVETPFGWSGMVAMARKRLPFVGAIPDHPGLFAGLCYHGNGVAMGSYSGALLADLVQGITPRRLYPDAIKRPLAKFELGRLRRLILPGAYAGLMLADL